MRQRYLMVSVFLLGLFTSWKATKGTVKYKLIRFMFFIVILTITSAVFSSELYSYTKRNVDKRLIEVSLRVHIIHTIYNLNGIKEEYPKYYKLNIPISLINHIGAYGAAGMIWLGPKGWAGTASQGSDNSTTVVLGPYINKLKDYIVYNPNISTPYIQYENDGGCAGCSEADAATFFLKARHKALSDGFYPSAVPLGLHHLQHVDPHTVSYRLYNNHRLLACGVAYYQGGDYYFFQMSAFVLQRHDITLLHFLQYYYINHGK